MPGAPQRTSQPMTAIDHVPFWLVFLGSIALVLVPMDLGHRLGVRRRLHGGREREAATSVITAGLVSLNSFFLAFIFGMVADRYEGRQALVREDAASIRIAYLRTDLLQEPVRSDARGLLRAYLDERLEAVASGDVEATHVRGERDRLQAMQTRLWSEAVPVLDTDADGNATAAYRDALEALVAVDVRRWSVGYQSRLPGGVWFLLGALNMCGMFGIGYLVGNSGSRRSLLTPLLAFAFAIVITLIAILDRPDGHVTISQQPLLDLRAYLSTHAHPVRQR